MNRLRSYVFGKLPSTSKAANITDKMAEKISVCLIHDNNKYPNLRSIEYCKTCQIGMWYTCGNEHIDKGHIMDWGYDIFKYMEAPRDDSNELMNLGYRTILDLEDAKWPWGMILTPFTF